MSKTRGIQRRSDESTCSPMWSSGSENLLSTQLAVFAGAITSVLLHKWWCGAPVCMRGVGGGEGGVHLQMCTGNSHPPWEKK